MKKIYLIKCGWGLTKAILISSYIEKNNKIVNVYEEIKTGFEFISRSKEKYIIE